MGIGIYRGQERKLRELAVRELGAEKVSLMTEEDVSEWVEGRYEIFWGDLDDRCGNHGCDAEVVVLVPNDVFESIRESVVWINR